MKCKNCEKHLFSGLDWHLRSLMEPTDPIWSYDVSVKCPYCKVLN